MSRIHILFWYHDFLIRSMYSKLHVLNVRIKNTKKHHVFNAFIKKITDISRKYKWNFTKCQWLFSSMSVTLTTVRLGQNYWRAKVSLTVIFRKEKLFFSFISEKYSLDFAFFPQKLIKNYFYMLLSKDHLKLHFFKIKKIKVKI